jgi:hypothetical protein
MPEIKKQTPKKARALIARTFVARTFRKPKGSKKPSIQTRPPAKLKASREYVLSLQAIKRKYPFTALKKF